MAVHAIQCGNMPDKLLQGVGKVHLRSNHTVVVVARPDVVCLTVRMCYCGCCSWAVDAEAARHSKRRLSST